MKLTEILCRARGKDRRADGWQNADNIKKVSFWAQQIAQTTKRYLRHNTDLRIVRTFSKVTLTVPVSEATCFRIGLSPELQVQGWPRSKPKDHRRAEPLKRTGEEGRRLQKRTGILLVLRWKRAPVWTRMWIMLGWVRSWQKFQNHTVSHIHTNLAIWSSDNDSESKLEGTKAFPQVSIVK